MMRRSGTVSIIHSACIGLTVLTAASPPVSAHAESADLVLCDRLAADPTDPDKPADVKGARDIDRADVATAIKFCKVASAASRRALYQLGRAYAANQQWQDVVTESRVPLGRFRVDWTSQGSRMVLRSTQLRE